MSQRSGRLKHYPRLHTQTPTSLVRSYAPSPPNTITTITTTHHHHHPVFAVEVSTCWVSPRAQTALNDQISRLLSVPRALVEWQDRSGGICRQAHPSVTLTTAPSAGKDVTAHKNRLLFPDGTDREPLPDKQTFHPIPPTPSLEARLTCNLTLQVCLFRFI